MQGEPVGTGSQKGYSARASGERGAAAYLRVSCGHQ